MPKSNDFMGMRNRNKVRDWGWDGETNEVAADSSMMTDQSRVKTESRYKENPKYVNAQKKSMRTGVPMDYSIPSGKFVEEKVDLMEHVRDNMGRVLRGTIYKTPKKRDKGGLADYPTSTRGW